MRDISCLVAPILAHAFFEQREFERLLGDDLFQFAGLTPQVLDFVRGRGARLVTGEAALAGFKEFLRPAVVQAFCDALAAAQLRDRDFAAKAVENDSDFFFRRILLAVARRMSRTRRSDGLWRTLLAPPGGFCVEDFRIICAPCSRFDDPEILQSSRS